MVIKKKKEIIKANGQVTRELEQVIYNESKPIRKVVLVIRIEALTVISTLNYWLQITLEPGNIFFI